MRYDKKVWFCREGDKEYDKETGNYKVSEGSADCHYAAVINTSSTTANLIYGELNEGSRTIHLQQWYEEPFDFLRIGEPNSAEYQKRYKKDMTRNLGHKQIIVCHEVQ